MKKLREFFKIINIFDFLILNIAKSILFKNKLSKLYLTRFYLTSLQYQSKVPTIDLSYKTNADFVISSLVLLDESESMEERFLYLTYKEILNLLTLIKIGKPKNIFEFGLMKGGSLYHMIKNTSEEVSIQSLDITANNLSPLVANLIDQTQRVKVHISDSKIFDFSSFKNKMDFIFIDGGHDFDIVKSDTENALKMLSNEGMIVWDDYNRDYPGVFKVVNQLARKGYKINHIRDTSLAFYYKLPT